MDKKDLFIKEKLQQDKKIPKDIDDMFKNFKGGDIKMGNNSKPKFVFAKVLGIAACMVLAVLVGLAIANPNGQIIKIGEKDKASSREEVELKGFSEEAVRASLQKYLNLSGTLTGSPEEMLIELGLLNRNDKIGEQVEVEGVPYITTNIKYSDFKDEMLKYVSEKCFEEKFARWFKSFDYVYYFDGGATGRSFQVINVNRINDTQYTAEVYEKMLDGSKELQKYSFSIALHDGRCVIDSCEQIIIPTSNNDNSNETENNLNVYSSIIDEYKAAMNDTNYNVETATAKYPNINKNMMQHYHNEKFKIYYAKYDINKDNYEDLIIYADLGKSNYTIIDVFGYYPYSNGKYDLIKLINEETLGERSKLEIFDNGIMYLHGSGSAFSGVLEFIKMSTNTDHVTEGNKYYYEYDENGNITIYLDEGVKRKTDYSSIDEVVNLYKKGAKVVNLSSLNLIEIGELVILDKSNIQSYLGYMGDKGANFCIEDIQKNGNTYTITASMLGEKRIISKAEYDNLKNGKKISFRNKMWEYITYSNGESVKSGDDELTLIYDTNKGNGYLDNAAGSATDGLKDYSNITVKFNVSKDVLIGTFWNDFILVNDIIKAKELNSDDTIDDFQSLTFDKLLTKSEGCKGTYDECKAYVHNGEVLAIKIFFK